ncbi:hypothetical protein SLEP1_g11065 [Rubroshorea leprosula]|uniref:Uncharacterized protein n=1 Tax=Rubroshorea leprosula TaxID=152421 RepID=A0AAV5IJD6_9ROSI|nr:hypothetical protein SLEP1_g11065 [Rubroshorea leprosula]
MMASSIPTRFHSKPSYTRQMLAASAGMEAIKADATKPRSRKPSVFSYLRKRHGYHNHYSIIFKPISSSSRTVLRKVSDDGAIGATPKESSSSDSGEISSSSSTIGDNYVALFVRMLGLDHDPLDREQAVDALWKYSLGGKKCIDAIMQFHGCLILVVNLLSSESSYSCEAAAGLLRSISSINLYGDSVAESGAIEEIASLLSRPSLTSEVKEQSICTLWNLSVDEKLRVKIADMELLMFLLKSLDDDNIKVKEASGGVLANLALSQCNHQKMVEVGVIPKLAAILNDDVKATDIIEKEARNAWLESNVIRKEARNALLELAKDDYYKILIIEEGLVLVPLVGAEAYKSFKPQLHSWPSLPDGTEIKHTAKGPSKYGASELLLGLNVDKNVKIDEAKINAMVRQSNQQFLARIGAIELIDEGESQSKSPNNHQVTLLPWMDGVARLVLILGLEDEVAISRAAGAIADSCINEHMRSSFKEAGAIKHLIQLLDHNSYAVRCAVAHALERLSVSPGVCQAIEAGGAVCALVNALKDRDICESLMQMTLDTLVRVLDSTKEMESKFYDGAVNGSKKVLDDAGSLDASTGLTGNEMEIPAPKTNSRKELLDSALIARLVEILKTASPNLQRKAASILEFVTILDPSIGLIVSSDIASALDANYQQKGLKADIEADAEGQDPEKYALELEEIGLSIHAASQLLTKLLDSNQFCETINADHFTKRLRNIIKSNIPLNHKESVAACLVKLNYLSGPVVEFENPINMEVTLYETIPRLIEQMRSSFSPEAQEAAVVELNRIVSEGVVDSTQAVASEGGIFPLVNLIENGSERAVEAGLAILYNLSMDIENHPAIIAAGAVPVLKRIVQSQRPQWTRALQLLRNLPV